MKLRVLGRIASVIVLSATVCSIPAGAAFSPIKTLSTPTVGSDEPRIGIDADGDAVAIWKSTLSSDYRVQARSFSLTGVLGPIQTLSPAGHDAQQLAIAVAGNGASIIAWQRSDGTKLRAEGRYRQANGTLTPAVFFSAAGADAFSPQVAFFPSGHGIVVWGRRSGSITLIQARTISPAGQLGAVKLLSRPGINSGAPRVAVDKNGNALVIWDREVNFDTSFLEGRTMTQAGGLGTIQSLSPRGDVSGAVLGIDNNRKAIIAWCRNNKIEARVRNANGTLGSVIAVSTSSGDSPVLSVAKNGDAVFAWHNDEFQIFGRGRTNAGALSSVRLITPTEHGGSGVGLGVNATGVFNVIYTVQFDLDDQRIQRRTFTAGGVLGTETSLSPANRLAGQSAIAVDGSGKIAVVWQDFTNTPSRIVGRRGP